MKQKIPYIHTELIHNFSAAKEVCPLLLKMFKPDSVLDIGCGTGTWLAVFKELGVLDIFGIDGDYIDRSMLKISKENFLPYDISERIHLNRRFDLVLCLEVAEHLARNKSDELVKNLVNHGDTILFSAAIPGQGGQNHINEQWPSYWNEIFNSFGYFPFDILRQDIWENKRIDWWYRQNMVIYANKESSIAKRYAPSQEIVVKIHPELLDSKNSEISYLKYKIDNPSFDYLLNHMMKKIMAKVFPGRNTFK